MLKAPWWVSALLAVLSRPPDVGLIRWWLNSGSVNSETKLRDAPFTRAALSTGGRAKSKSLSVTVTRRLFFLRRLCPEGGGGLCNRMENVMVGQSAIRHQNLLARAPSGYGLKNAIQLCPKFFRFHIGPNRSVASLVLLAWPVPDYRTLRHLPHRCAFGALGQWAPSRAHLVSPFGTRSLQSAPQAGTPSYQPATC